MQIQFLLDFQSTVFCSTASMALLMAEEINRRGLTGEVATLLFNAIKTSCWFFSRSKLDCSKP